MRVVSMVLAALVAASIFPPNPHAQGGSSYDITFANLLEAGRSQSVAVRGDYLYGGLGNHLLVLDITNPTKPARVASRRVVTVSPLWSINDIALVGAYALTASDAGLHIFDVSDPLNPIQVAVEESDDALGIAVSGNVAFVTSGASGIRSVDITNPANPVVIGTASTSAWPIKIRVSGQHAFAAGYQGTLLVIDISDPTAPYEIVNLDVGGASWGLDVAGSLAFLPLRFGGSGMSIIDISTPAAPVEIGKYASSSLDGTDVIVNDSYAYLTEGAYDLRVIDVSNPTSPFMVTRISDQGGWEVATQGGYLYVADSESRFRVIDITNPTALSVVGSYETIEYGRSVNFAGDYAYLGEEGGGFRIIDIANPADPSFELRWPSTVGRAMDIDNDGSNLVVGLHDYWPDSDFSGFHIFDNNDPLSPTELSFIYGFDVVYDIQADEGYVYGLAWERGYKFFTYDITDASTPTQLAVADLPGSARRLDVAHNTAYVAGGTNGLLIFDITDRSNPIQVATFGSTSDITDVKTHGDAAYLAARAEGLIILDVSDPSSPIEVTRVADLGSAHFVTIQLPYAIVSSDDMLRIIDVEEPTDMKVVASYNTTNASPVAVSGGTIGLLQGIEGSLLLLEADFLDPSPDLASDRPILSQNYPNPFNPRTTIEFIVASGGNVDLVVFDAVGRRVVTLANRVYQSGPASVEWDGRDTRGQPVTSGVYFYRLRFGNSTHVKKMVLLR